MATQELKLKTLLLIGAGILVVDSILFGLGGWCLQFVDMPHSTALEREYMRANVCKDIELDFYCTTFKPSMPPHLTKCECKFQIVLEQDIKGAVTLYYELEEFDQTNSSYASSKDEMQLLGTPGERPAESCGNYSYREASPIFPCGEIADSIFNDTFTLLHGKDIVVPVEYTDLITGETLKYRNPSPEVKKNYSSPINWGKPWKGRQAWEVESALGVENPAFRAWMDTSLKRKPVWRVQRKDTYSGGLPAGNYTLVIMMRYGVDRYDGPRKIILEGVYTESVRRNLGWGIVLIILASILLVLGAAYIYKQRKGISTIANNKTKPSNDQAETPLLNVIYNRLRSLRAK